MIYIEILTNNKALSDGTKQKTSFNEYGGNYESKDDDDCSHALNLAPYNRLKIVTLMGFCLWFSFKCNDNIRANEFSSTKTEWKLSDVMKSSFQI